MAYLGSNPRRLHHRFGAAMGCGSRGQRGCLDEFDSRGLHQTLGYLMRRVHRPLEGYGPRVRVPHSPPELIVRDEESSYRKAANTRAGVYNE